MSKSFVPLQLRLNGWSLPKIGDFIPQISVQKVYYDESMIQT